MYTNLKIIAAALLGAGIAAALQERRVRRSHYDPAFGMLSRAGVDARLRGVKGAYDVLFIDLDHVHELGYPAVDARVRAAFQLRRGDAQLIGRWYSGDEILVIAPAGDGVGLAQRLAQRLAAQGLSATIAVAGGGAQRAIAQAAAEVQQAKRAGVRGCVLGGGAR